MIRTAAPIRDAQPTNGFTIPAPHDHGAESLRLGTALPAGEPSGDSARH